MPPPANRFPSPFQTLLLIVGLYLLETVFVYGLHDLRGLHGLPMEATLALAVLLANGVVLGVATRAAGIGYRELFHGGRASLLATASLLTVPVLAIVPGLAFVMSLVNEALTSVFPYSRWEEAAFARMGSGSLPMVVMVCVLAPVLEEMLFRGVVLRGFLARFPRWPAIWLSALVFGAAHLNLYQFVVGVASGLLLGWLYERTRSLLPGIVLHGAYNTLCVALADTPDDLTLLAAWLPVAAAGAWALRRLLRAAPQPAQPAVPAQADATTTGF